jgi:predicted Zn-dependent protease
VRHLPQPPPNARAARRILSRTLSLLPRRHARQSARRSRPRLHCLSHAAPPIRERNLALALVSAGLQNSNADQVIRGFRMLVRLEPALSNDAPALTALGTVLLKGKQPVEAARRFARALSLRPNYAPYEVNLAVALAGSGNPAAAVGHLERALQIDPLLQQAVQLVAALYRANGESQKADALLSGYLTAMGITLHPRRPDNRN